MSSWTGFTSTDGFYDSPMMLGAKRVKYERSEVMPIDGLTDIDRPPRQGMLRLGIKKKTADGKKEYPCEVDYFILDPETPNEADQKKIIDKFHEVFGKNPKTIEVRLIASDINETFPQNYKRYGKSTPLKCIGDGETATVTETDWCKGLKVIGKDKRGFDKVTCKGRDCVYATANDKAQQKECKATATLSVNIPQLGGLGVWQLTTGSFNSIVNINSGIRELNETYGRCHDIPLMLERRPQETAYKGKKALHYTLHLNETPKTAEEARALQASMFEELEKENEVLDGDGIKEVIDADIIKEVEASAAEENEIDRLAEADTEKSLMVNCPPVDENTHRLPGAPGTPGDPPEPTKTEMVHVSTTGTIPAIGAVQENTKVVEGLRKEGESLVKAEIAEKADKVIKAFDGTPADNESKEFLEGLKLASKEELGVEGGKPIKSRAIDKEKEATGKTILGAIKTLCPDVPENFPPFMAWCKAKLETANKGKMYKDAFELYSVKTPADLSKDIKKQEDMRVYLSGLLMDEGLV
jgi:hypothetical protein